MKALPILLLLVVAGPALAEECWEDVTPTACPRGASITGEYDRHHFTYVVPAGEPGAGATINMVLLSELQMQLKPPAGNDQLWRRCGKPVS